MQPARRWAVVGAGSAGCVVASRLADHPGNDVTLFEAGPRSDGSGREGTASPDFFDALSTEFVWPDLVAQHPGGRQRSYLRGRGVGGSSLVNALIALAPESSPIAVPAATPEHRLPITLPDNQLLGAVDRALLASDTRARKAPLTLTDGRRVSSADAYEVYDRERLTVRDCSPVESVRRRPGESSVEAWTVLLASGEEFVADSVVLCAGAIHSPAILLRSGIGSGAVGEGLQDHPSLPIALELRAVDDGHRQPTLATGALGEFGSLQVLSMNHLGAVGSADRHMGMLMPALMRPVGVRGSVRLATDDEPSVASPVIAFDLTADQRDVSTLLEGLGIVERLLVTEPFQALVTDAFVDDHGTRLVELSTAERREQWVRSAVGDYVHASSTCAIGRVVDACGQVYDHHSLFVCDASVFPHIPEVNTHLPTTLLAEAMVATWLR